MERKKQTVSLILCAAGMFAMIMDPKTAVSGAAEGIGLCIRVVIPSLFPMLVLSGMLTAAMAGRKSNLFHPLEKLCKLPSGSGVILATGLIGGYPLGAKLIGQAHKEGTLSMPQARRLLGFCSNAGPAFIFGMCACMFGSPLVPWVIWLIQILSALAVGMLLPGIKDSSPVETKGTGLSFTEAMASGIKTMGLICGWVVLMRVLLQFLTAWVLWYLSDEIRLISIGLLELTNGIAELSTCPDEQLRFVLCCVFMSFGGLCVCMQTASVTARIGTGMYLPGKLLQAGISAVLSLISGCILFGTNTTMLLAAAGMTVFVLFFQKTVAFFAPIIYNGRKRSGGLGRVFPKEDPASVFLLRIRHKHG